MLELSNMSFLPVLRFLLLMLFTLLQCVAPLAHAHVNGESSDQHVHLATLDSSWLNDHVDDLLSVAHAEAGEHSSVVTMQPEYRNNDHSQVFASIVRIEPLFTMRKYIAIVFEAPPQCLPVSPPHQHPCSQAPPVKYS